MQHFYKVGWDSWDATYYRWQLTPTESFERWTQSWRAWAQDKTFSYIQKVVALWQPPYLHSPLPLRMKPGCVRERSPDTEGQFPAVGQMELVKGHRVVTGLLTKHAFFSFCSSGAVDATPTKHLSHTRHWADIWHGSTDTQAAYRSSAEKPHDTPTPATENVDNNSGDSDNRDNSFLSWLKTAMSLQDWLVSSPLQCVVLSAQIWFISPFVCLQQTCLDYYCW